MKSPLKNIKLTSYDELLNPEIAQENGEKIQQINPLDELKEYVAINKQANTGD